MPQAKDEAGNIWETDAAGNAVRLIQPAQQGQVFTLPPSPKEQRQEARADEDQQLQRDAADRAERAAERADKTAQRQAAAAERTANAAAKPTEFQSKSAGFLGRMLQAEKDFSAVPASDRGGRSVPRQAFHNIAPGIENTLVNSPERQKADQAVENFIAASLRQESGAAISPVEFTRQYKIFFPAPGDSEEVLAQKAEARRQAIDSFRIMAGPLAEQAEGTVKEQAETPGNPLQQQQAPQGPGLEVATGRTRNEYSPKVSGQIDAMINAGASKAMIDAALKTQGFGPIRADDLQAAKKWMKDNPGKRYFGAQITKPVALNAMQRFAGSPLGSGLAHAANAGTAGLVGLASGEQGRGALDAMSAMNPNASLAGDIAGGVTGALGMEAGVAARAPEALVKYAPRVADFLYGGLTGFNSANEGEGAQGALLGGAAGLGGGILGQKVAGGLGAVTRGVADPAIQRLRAAGIPLTVGQALTNSGFLGKSVRGAEDRLSGFWGVGDVVRDRQREGVEAIANRMANDAVAPIGGTVEGYGQPVVDDLLQQGSDAYTAATAGAHVPLDPQFATDMAQTRALGSILPDDLAMRFGKAIDNRVGPVEADSYLTGDTFQQAVRGLKGYRAEATKPGFEQDYRNALSQGIDALKGQMNRGGGADVVENLANADRAWRQIKIIQKATEAARNGARSGEVGLPMPSHFNDAALASASKFGGARFNAELIDDAQRILPNKVPDSGTAGRLGLAGLALGGTGLGAGVGTPFGEAGTGAGAGLGLTLLLAAGGSKPAQKLLTDILIKRPQAARTVGDLIARNANVGGWTGAGVLTPLTVGP